MTCTERGFVVAFGFERLRLAQGRKRGRRFDPARWRVRIADQVADLVAGFHEELDVVEPRLIIGLGGDAEKMLTARYPDAHRLRWPFAKPRNRMPGPTHLLFPEHPGSLRFKKTADRAYYSPSLARAITWGFEVE